MNRKLPVFLFAITGAVTVALILLCRDLDNSSGLRFISDATGIRFPQGCSGVDVHDGGEFFVAAHLRLPLTHVDDFIAEYGFSDTIPVIEPWIGLLDPGNREVPGNAVLAGLEGRSEQNSWACALDPHSGRLWVFVFYPDPGGTPP